MAFAGTVAVGFVAMPGAAATYWTDRLLAADRVGPPALAHNQSAYGALTRLLDGTPPTLLWLAVAGPLALAVLLVGAGWWRHGDRVLGTCLGALAMLLASPISWSHHWVWGVPVALVLWERSRWAGVAWTALFVARPIVWPPYGQHREYGWSPRDHLVGNAYLLAGLVVFVWAAATLNRRAPPPPGSSGEPDRQRDDRCRARWCSPVKVPDGAPRTTAPTGSAEPLPPVSGGRSCRPSPGARSGPRARTGPAAVTVMSSARTTCPAAQRASTTTGSPQPSWASAGGYGGGACRLPHCSSAKTAGSSSAPESVRTYSCRRRWPGSW